MSSHPGKSYPTFRLTISEEAVYTNTSKDKLFGYAIEAPKGPVNEPTFVASNEEAMRVFGVNFAPHFYQKGAGLVITRVGLPNSESASISYYIKTTTTTTIPAANDGEEDTINTDVTYKEAFTITALDKGQSEIQVKVIPSIGVGGGWSVIVTIPNVTSQTYNTLPTFRDVVKTINNNFGSYLKAEQKVDTNNMPINDLVNENGVTESLVVLKTQTAPDTLTDAAFETNLDNNDGTLKGGSFGQLFDGTKTMVEIERAQQADGTYDASVLKTDNLSTYQLYTGAASDFDGDQVKADITLTATVVYKKAFDLMKGIDLIGVTTLSELDVVQSALFDHIEECLDPETNILRFGITAFLDYNNPKKQNWSLNDVQQPAIDLNSEYFIYIGQGVKFKQDDGLIYDLPPHKAIMLYTGIRSALTYDTAIFGGEDKKILNGVVDVLDIVPGQILYKTDREELNENGVTTFKKEYDRVTFLEGVTTSQDSDVLAYEYIMSIVIYITKRLVRVAKTYQGKKMTEDLKESLKTALTSELRTIQQTDNCLMAIHDENYEIPAFDVSVESAAMVRFNDMGELIRESKVIAKVKIVPIGALRDIDLGVIVI